MIEIAPIQVTDEGVLIPRQYLSDSDEFEIVLSETYVLVRPKKNGPESNLLPSESSRFSFVGIAHTSNPNASKEVEEILEREIDRRSGWTLDK